MKKITIGGRISKLRGGKTQAEFAKELGVTQGAVSAWERNDKERAPSADVYFRLGSLAHDPDDSLFFWKLAGVGSQALLLAANKVFKGSFTPPRKGEIVRLSPLPGGLGQRGGELVFPAALVPNPATTYFVRFTKRPLYWFGPGDTLVVDTHDGDKPDLSPLAGSVVLIQLPFRRGPKGELLDNPDKDKGVLMGRLWLSGSEGKLGLSLIPVGMLSTGGWVIADHWMPEGDLSPVEAEAKAAREIRLSPDWRVIGRLIAYLPGDGRLFQEEID